jgi:hypothetical protein
MQFITQNSAHSTLHVGNNKKYIEETVNTKFLGLPIGSLIKSKNHIEGIIPKFSTACYAITSMVHTSNILHCKFVYVFIYNLFYILLSTWHTYGSMEYMYIQMCIYYTHITYVQTYRTPKKTVSQLKKC